MLLSKLFFMLEKTPELCDDERFVAIIHLALDDFEHLMSSLYRGGAIDKDTNTRGFQSGDLGFDRVSRIAKRIKSHGAFLHFKRKVKKATAAKPVTATTALDKETYPDAVIQESDHKNIKQTRLQMHRADSWNWKQVAVLTEYWETIAQHELKHNVDIDVDSDNYVVIELPHPNHESFDDATCDGMLPQ